MTMPRARWLIAVFILVLPGCAIPTSFLGYLENRRQDLIDVVHVDLTVIEVGAVAYVGPFLLGFDDKTGFRPRTPSSSLQIGLGGPRIAHPKGLAYGLFWIDSKWNDERPVLADKPKRSPSGFSVGASVGALLGVGAEVDALEAVDFVLGLVCVDLVEDDGYLDAEPKPPVPPAPPPPPKPDPQPE